MCIRDSRSNLRRRVRPSPGADDDGDDDDEADDDGDGGESLGSGGADGFTALFGRTSGGGSVGDGGSGRCESKRASPGGGSRKPIDWFGAMAPPQLRRAERTFASAVELVARIATVSSELRALTLAAEERRIAYENFHCTGRGDDEL